MKKFSWIFALILALSMAFIGCPADDGDDNGGGGGGGGSSLGLGAAIPPEVGTFTYVDGGYQYAYGSVANSNYGNVIIRFKLDLGDKTLGDYGSATFKWKATGYSDDGDNVVSSKRLFLLATDVEGHITPPQNTDGPNGPEGAGAYDNYWIKKSIVSTTFYNTDANLSKAPYSGDLTDYPGVNGVGEMTVTLPIVNNPFLGLGEVWFAIYVHAAAGSYTITDFQLNEGDYTGGVRIEGTEVPAPTKPLPTGEPNAWFYLDLSTITTVTGAVEGVPTAVTPVWNATTKTLTGTFSGAGRLNVDLSPAQLTALKARSPVSAESTDSGNNINVIVKGRLVSGDADQNKFRYSIGDASRGSSWATWHPVGGNSAFASIMGYKHWVAYANQGAEPKNFILNYQGSGAAVVEITSIRIEFENGSTGGEIASSSTTKGEFAVTLAAGDAQGRSGTITDETNGFTYQSTGDNYERAFAYFKVTLPTDYTLGQYTNISYKITGGAGTSDDGGYKGFVIAAFVDEAAIDAIPKAGDSDGAGGTIPEGADTTKLPTANEIITASWRATGIENLDTEYVRDVRILTTLPAGTADLNEVWIAVRVGAKKGFEFKLTDVIFY